MVLGLDGSFASYTCTARILCFRTSTALAVVIFALASMIRLAFLKHFPFRYILDAFTNHLSEWFHRVS
jgi:hypothetical protein